MNSTTTSTHARPPRAVSRAPWAGTADLLRLYLRLDRLRIIIWSVALALVYWSSVAALEVAFPDEAARQTRATLMDNPSSILLSGPAFSLDDYTFGAMVANEISLIMLVAVAIMAILLVVRHTRAEEESGRMETVRALAVGHYAAPTAALLAVTVAVLAVGLGVFAVGALVGLALLDSLVFGLAVAVTGLVFGAVAGVAAQITEHARSASGMAMAVLGAAFLTRGIGDIINPTGSWLSWTSPIAWAQQTRLYVDLRVWPLALSLVAVALALAVSVALARRRDLGAGLRPPRPGPAVANPRLLSVPGLAHRLLWGTSLAWGVGVTLFAISIGSLAETVTDAFDDMPEIGDWIALDEGQMLESFSAVMIVMLLVGVVAQGVSGVLRWRAEDDAGRVGSLVVTGGSRAGSYAGWLAVVVLHVVLTLTALGAGLGLAMGASTGDWSWVGGLTVAAWAYLPAVLVVIGVAVALVGVWPRRAGLAWVLVLYCLLVAWLGPALQLPTWAMNLSPIELSAAVPQVAVDWPLMLALAAGAIALHAAGIAGFRRRDLLA